ncbi:hypothetical protein KAJ83_05840 [Marivibrio halodurans]|uniref:Biotin carboxyl carrier protein of acetyl-CoA carboxylase n=1 Tax=Marivibrio halodurans TaxID=2039722 RepID=A0A8J7V373_9PROT|nr:biotin/lipoyl-containing protein [Marivibrio halodurans]MBP5856519.1 hypothetical protein [Marivibrio halodurans]
MSGPADLTHQAVVRILQIVDQAEDLEVLVEYGGMKLRVQKGAAGAGAPLAAFAGQAAHVPVTQPAAQPAPAVAAPAAAPAPPPAGDGPEVGADGPGLDGASDALPEGAVAVAAPMMGTFYRASNPSAPPFVEVGDRIGPDDTVALIEVMKLFNTVEAGVGGTVLEIRAGNGAMVEEGQTILVVRPD